MTESDAPSRRSHSYRVALRVSVLAFVLTLLAISAISAYSLRQFRAELIPEYNDKARTIGDVIGEQVLHALELGIPFDALRGVDEFLHEVLEHHEELVYLAITDRKGKVLHAAGKAGFDRERVQGHVNPRAGAGSGIAAEPLRDDARDSVSNVALPLEHALEPIGSINVGVDNQYAQTLLAELLWDILTIMLVSLLVTFEMKLILVGLYFGSPLGVTMRMMRQGRQGDFSRSLQPGSRDEIGRLIEAVNAAMNCVNSRFARVREQAQRLAQHSGGRAAEIAEQGVAALQRRYRFATRADAREDYVGRATDRLVTIRFPFFLFVAAEELSRSFFPVYVRDVYAHGRAPSDTAQFLSNELIVGMPISAFMLVVAIATPIAGRLVDRIGSRRMFLWGLVPALLGYVMTAFADGLGELLLWRVLTAVGYGTIFIACQGFILDNTDARSRASGMAMYVGAIMAADICGPAIGGVIADRIGYGPTFLASAALTLLSAAFVLRLLPRAQSKAEGEAPRITIASLRQLLLNGRFAAVVLFAAIPAKLMLTGFLYFLVPLFLFVLSTPSEIGRIIMVYGITAILVTPWTARLADRTPNKLALVVLGGVLAGCGTLPLLVWQNQQAVLVAVAVLGIAQAISITPQAISIPIICERECERIGRNTVLAIYRLLERIGAVLGPLVAALLVGRFDYPTAMAIMGGVVLGGALMLGIVVLATTARRPAAGAAAA